MRRYSNYIILLVFSALFLYGCLESRGAFLFIDLKDMAGEVRYLDIVSTAEEKKEIQEDFRELIESRYLGVAPENELASVTITSKALYGDKGRLNGKIKFTFNDPVKTLDEFEIRPDDKGDYILKLDDNTAYEGGNGEYIEQGSKRIVKWSRDMTTIEMHLRFKGADGGKGVSLYPYWQEWKKGN